jgi:RNA polymerase sigma factor (sigma-70 family)
MVRWCLTPLGQQIVDLNRGIAGKVAKRFAWAGTSAADRRAAAYLGLCYAAATFNPSLGIRFSTYAFSCCRREVWEDYGRDHVINQPRHVLEGRISAHLGEQARQVRQVELWPTEILADVIPNPREFEFDDPDPMPGRIRQVMARYLSRRERAIVEARIAGRTLAEVARELGISKERVRQIEASAYRRIRTMMGVGVS